MARYLNEFSNSIRLAVKKVLFHWNFSNRKYIDKDFSTFQFFNPIVSLSRIFEYSNSLYNVYSFLSEYLNGVMFVRFDSRVTTTRLFPPTRENFITNRANVSFNVGFVKR